MVWAATALARLDESRLKESREETFKRIGLMMKEVPISMHDVRVGPPLFPDTTGGYDISTSQQNMFQIADFLLIYTRIVTTQSYL